ncbi:OsmC family peroxiredoxin [Leptospira gomenensis]|uniref:OsmC family peroxiredoxin n=1 Tax=Leptospira gomenensis TaxID=2484974 RepID=A0A5F1Z1A3_9LEPT|nr:OsmC family protein [Leptospira gomenensis]TGK27915.1 OsmC family peroxiredoxin [Leptospira gomenensis]TGK45479.1 OsmC family peroxiredoxin [Leptospira gomenensis]TGK45866.1 OsmC family peroxiredoxin [Leptospira gomenensis]TGK65208.1 OsmC family peroxiredoxin [Leptospira gomenensis]
MSEHKVGLSWKKGPEEFKYESYDRTHTVRYAGGQTLSGSSTLETYGKAEFANPEEMLAAAVCSCHFLTFLAVAAKSRYVVSSYEDNAIAILEKNQDGKMVVTKVDLYPVVRFEGEKIPDHETLEGLHEKAHRNCFISNSIRSEVNIHIQSV